MGLGINGLFMSSPLTLFTGRIYQSPMDIHVYILSKSEDGMVDFFLFKFVNFDFRENRRVARRPSSKGAQSQCPNKKKGQKLVEKSPFLC